jgi:hypothetical protein
MKLVELWAKTVGQKRRIRIAVATDAAGGLGVAGVSALVATDPIGASVTAVVWESSVEIELFQQTYDSGWSAPDQAYDIDRDWRYRTTEKRRGQDRLVSYQCGTGTCLKTEATYTDEIVYDWWYEYSINRWRPDHTLVVSGTDRVPYEPSVERERLNPADVIGNKRAGRRTRTYTVTFETAEPKTYVREVTAAEWATYTVGDAQHRPVRYPLDRPVMKTHDPTSRAVLAVSASRSWSIKSSWSRSGVLQSLLGSRSSSGSGR